jgi:hypothetical protein
VDEARVYLYNAYRKVRRPLLRAIKEAKKRAWDELLATLDSDHWGRPYRLVLNKFRPCPPPARGTWSLSSWRKSSGPCIRER